MDLGISVHFKGSDTLNWLTTSHPSHDLKPAQHFCLSCVTIPCSQSAFCHDYPLQYSAVLASWSFGSEDTDPTFQFLPRVLMSCEKYSRVVYGLVQTHDMLIQLFHSPHPEGSWRHMTLLSTNRLAVLTTKLLHNCLPFQHPQRSLFCNFSWNKQVPRFYSSSSSDCETPPAPRLPNK